MMIESAMAIRFPSGSSFCSSTAFPYFRSILCSDDPTSAHASSRRFSNIGCFDMPCYQKVNGGSGSISRRKSFLRNKIRAAAEHLDSAADPSKYNGRTGYHPFEDISELASVAKGEARLTAAETTRTIVEVNSKATLLFSGVVDDEVHENILWPELPYATDEQGNVYFQVNNDEDIMQALASENHMVQMIVGLDTMEMVNEIELSGPAEIDFTVEELGDEDSDFEEEEDSEEDDGEDDYEEDFVSVIEDEEDLDESDGNLGDWAKLDTMRSSHPMYFAKKLVEVASDDPIDWMEPPPVGVVIQGLLMPILLEEKLVIQKLLSGHSARADINNTENPLDEKLEDCAINEPQEPISGGDGSTKAQKLEKDENLANGDSFYKLEMVKIQLLSVHGHPNIVEVEDFRKARPDTIAQSAAKIISRVKAGGEKAVQALKSLCWRCKGIQVEEAMIIGIDALGFDIRACSGTQLQTLRFSFETRVTSECSAERQLNNLLFPKAQQKTHKKKQPRQNGG
ncbi:hypothetical protein SAY87_011719 [Trapa incisa]|uniref:Pentatricopeptide repeat superfamily protein n=1 Tax=Trapa incisa TaxID=236973 RepID=A0AAN7GZT5_9MYRT|nr:hypothetical protein SAY87_011719 [Trapa incisa]